MEQLIIICLAFTIVVLLFKPKSKSKFLQMEQLDADELRLKIILMSVEEKEQMLEDLITYGAHSENNYKVAIVIQQYIIQDLKPSIHF